MLTETTTTGRCWGCMAEVAVNDNGDHVCWLCGSGWSSKLGRVEITNARVVPAESQSDTAASCNPAGTPADRIVAESAGA